MSAPAPSTSSGTWTKLIKVTVNLQKKQGVSDEEFSRYYAHTHAALAGPVLLRHNCISYTQFHCMSDKAEESMISIFGPDVLSPLNPVQIAPFDGCTTFLFPSLQDARRFFHDPETILVLGPDSANFANTASVRVAIGDEFVVISDNKVQRD